MLEKNVYTMILGWIFLNRKWWVQKIESTSKQKKKKKNEKGRKKRKGEKCEFPNTFENLRNWTLEKGLEKTKTMLRKIIFLCFI